VARHTTRHEVGPPLSVDEVRSKKIALISEIGQADSIRDYGGLWGVHGLYLLEGARALRVSFAEMIDVTPREEFLQASRRLQSELPVQINMIVADFRMPALYDVLQPTDVSLLYDVLLHQDTAVEVMRGVAAKTRHHICVAQPVLREDLLPLPNAAVNLQFYSEELKDELRQGSWWPKESPARRFDISMWMWGQTASYLSSIFSGYGWRCAQLELSEMGPYWNHALMRFVPEPD
jgi:hypothetical protein